MTEKDHYKYGLSGDKVDVEVAERLRAQIRELKAQDEVHWKTRRSLLAELERCRAANVYDGNAHRKVSALEELIIQHNVRAINEQHHDWVIPIDTKQIAFTAETACECRDAFGRHLPECPAFDWGMGK